MRIGRLLLRRLANGIAALVILVGCGSHDHAAGGPATTPANGGNQAAEVKVVARDLAFETEQKSYELNKPYHFAVRNSGVVDHEWVLTPLAAAGSHEHNSHADALGAIGSEELKPGASVTREVVFTEPGEYEMACHLPGHYEGGMKLVIKVQ